MAESSEDRVGYRKPPKQHRFQPVKSGNPNGRTKRKKPSLQAVVADELGKTMQVTQNGQKVSVTRLQAIVMRAAQDALTGTPIERRLAAKFLANYLPSEPAEALPTGFVVRLIEPNDEDL